jgi:NADH dehydrogenase (ubiquinone) flavoprotein 2
MADLHPENPYVKQRQADPSRPFEFAPEQMQEIEALFARYPTKQAALLPVLHIAQRVEGWLPPEVIVHVADVLELTPAYVFGVISFYNMYNQKPRGKFFLQVCTNLPCMLRGAYDIYEDLCERIGVRPGQNSEDGKYTVLEVECLGSCGTAPVVQVNNDYHEEMTVEKMSQLLERLD